ncbi:MAG: hypothetical protein K2M60_07850 [Lachnospiraceae bacterium]|nr:hypothetical protein [Lachnospiraceae bacterium]MDE6252754.1 hypothetical protein [Lachnospiraceae bacterium]
MEIRKCTVEDVKQLAILNKQLIDDEKRFLEKCGFVERSRYMRFDKYIYVLN